MSDKTATAADPAMPAAETETETVVQSAVGADRTALRAAFDAHVAEMQARHLSLSGEFTEWASKIARLATAVEEQGRAAVERIGALEGEITALHDSHAELAAAVTSPDAPEAGTASGTGKLAELVASLRNEVDHLKRAGRGGW